MPIVRVVFVSSALSSVSYQPIQLQSNLPISTKPAQLYQSNGVAFVVSRSISCSTSVILPLFAIVAHETNSLHLMVRVREQLLEHKSLQAVLADEPNDLTSTS